MFILAALSTLAGAIYSVYRWIWIRRFSIRFKISPEHQERAYILSVRIRRNQPPTVIKLGLWCHLNFYNLSSEPRLITQLSAYDDNSSSQPIVGIPVKDVHLDFAKDTTEGPIDLPLTLEPQHGISFWVMMSIPVPEKLGEILFQLFGQKTSTLKSFQRFDGHIPDIEKNVLEGIHDLPISIREVSLTFDHFDLYYPLLQKRDQSVVFNPELGSFPLPIYHLVAKKSKERDWLLQEVLSVPTRFFLIEAEIAGGSKLTHRFKVNHDALWWRRLTSGSS